MIYKVILILIISLSLFLRLYNLNWDSNQHLHPDERFLTMVAGGLGWPSTFSHYLDTSTSPLNPHNREYPFYVYGTFPVIFVKLVAEIVGMSDYDGLTLVGRFISALFDTGVVVLVSLISIRLTNSKKAALLASLLYTLSVLPIQLSHFYATDTFLVFFLSLSFYLLVSIQSSKHPHVFSALLGMAFGLAISSKISAVYFAPVIGIGYLIYFLRTKKLFSLIITSLFFILFLYLTIRLAYPYLFLNTSFFVLTFNPKQLANWEDLRQYSLPNFYYPPSTMWVHVKKLIYPLENLSLWGLGLPAFLVSVISTPFCLRRSKHNPLLAISVLWIISFFIYQGSQFSMPLRYFYPLFPFIAICGGFFLSNYVNTKPKLLLLLLLFVWPVSFISIYSRPHSRLQASDWIYSHIPPGSVLSCEHWDDCLPLATASFSPSLYSIEEFPLYSDDNVEKWDLMSDRLSKVDYIILSSNRLYGSIMTAPEHWPATYRFYTSLFDGSLGFEKVAEFSSRPNLPLPGLNLCVTPPFINYGKVAFTTQSCPLQGISFVDDYADETFTVYDHPKVIIFKKISPAF